MRHRKGKKTKFILKEHQMPSIFLFIHITDGWWKCDLRKWCSKLGKIIWSRYCKVSVPWIHFLQAVLPFCGPSHSVESQLVVGVQISQSFSHWSGHQGLWQQRTLTRNHWQWTAACVCPNMPLTHFILCKLRGEQYLGTLPKETIWSGPLFSKRVTGTQI